MAPSPDPESAVEAELDRALRRIATGTAMSPHPEPETLVAYQEGSLSTRAADEVRRHLVRCRSCSQEVLELAAFDGPEPHGEDLDPSQAQIERAVSRVRDSQSVDSATPPDDPQTDLAALATPENYAARFGSGPPNQATASKRMIALGGLAASVFLAAVLGTAIYGWLTADSGGDGGPFRAPFIADLAPVGSSLLRGSESEQLLEPPAFTDSLVLRLNVADQSPHESYRLKVHRLAENGAAAPSEPIWSDDALQRQPQGNFSVLVPRKQLPAGGYSLLLSGLSEGSETPLATYRMRVRYGE